MTRKPRSHVRILMYLTWTIRVLMDMRAWSCDTVDAPCLLNWERIFATNNQACCKLNWWKLSIWSDRWILEAKKEKTRSRIKTNRIRHPRRGHRPTEYSRKVKLPFRELKWNYSLCFTNGKFPPHFLWFFILTHKLMFCKQMNPNTRRTFTKFVINRVKTIFGTACLDMCMIFTSVLHRLSQYMNAVNTDRMVLACLLRVLAIMYLGLADWFPTLPTAETSRSYTWKARLLSSTGPWIGFERR